MAMWGHSTNGTKNMNNLAIEIDRLQKEYNKTAADLARLTGLNPPQLSRWRNGEQVSIKDDCLVRLASGFSKSPGIHARLLLARLNDCCTGPGAPMISIKLNEGVSASESEPQAKINLVPSIQKDLNIIATHISRNRQVRDIIRAVARLCGHDQQSSPKPTVECSSASISEAPSTASQAPAGDRMNSSPSVGEIPIRAHEAKARLGVGATFFSALKSKMGIKGRKRVFFSTVVAWLAAHPEFRETEVYHRPGCGCQQCIAKRANPSQRIRGRNRSVKPVNSTGQPVNISI